MLDREYTFDNLLLSRTNSLAPLSCKAAISEPQSYSPLLLHGPTGCGKTHILKAAGVYAEGGGKKALYTTVSDVTEHIIECLETDNHNPWEKYEGYSVILMDDISSLAYKPNTQLAVINIISKLYSQGKCVILTCDEHLSDIEGFIKRFNETFRYRLVIGIRPPDKALKRQYFERLCEDLGVEVTDDAVDMVSDFDGNLPLLKGRFITAMNNADKVKEINAEFIEAYFEF